MKKISLLLVLLLTILVIPQNIVKADGYTITIDESLKNISITLDDDNYNVGDTVRGVFKTDPGYYATNLYYKDDSSKEYNINYSLDGDFSFEMPTSNVTILAKINKTNVFEETTGIFGPEWSNKINNIAPMFNTSPKTIENNINNWLEQEYTPVSGAYVTTDPITCGTSDVITNLIITILAIDIEQTYGPTHKENPTTEEKLDVHTCVLNSDVFFKNYAMIINSFTSVLTTEEINTKYKGVIDSLINGMGDEIGKCTGGEAIKPINILRSLLKEAKKNAGKADGPTSNLNTLKAKMKEKYDLMGMTKTDEQLQDIIDETIPYLYTKGETYFTDVVTQFKDIKTPQDVAKFANENIDKAITLSSMLLGMNILNNGSMLEDYVPYANDINYIFGSYFNSDVLFKAGAKLIEAAQTQNEMTFITTVLSLFGAVKEEETKALREKRSIDDYIKFIIDNSYTKHEVINLTTKDESDTNAGYLKVVVENKNIDSEDKITNTSLVTLQGIPNDGYSLASLSYQDAAGVHVVSINSNGAGKFSMPNKAVTVKATFVKNPDPTDESCEKVIGPTWHWNDTKGVCEEYALVRTNTK